MDRTDGRLSAALVLAVTRAAGGYQPQVLEALHGLMTLGGTLTTPISIETFRFVGLLTPLGR